MLQLLTVFTIILIGCKKDKDVEPTAITLKASDLTPVAATLNGLINAHGLTTSVVFEYGTTSDY